ncbi:hypothetical protein JCM8097_008684 [Rhodosporidiobolus ruineniae]
MSILRASTIAILQPGQMGASFALAFRSAAPHIRLLTALSGRSARTKRLAAAHGIEDLGSLPAVLREAEVVLSVVVPDKAQAFAEEVAAAARKLAQEGELKTRFFVDLNAVAPGTVKAAAAAFEGIDGVEVVDGSIFGGPATATSAPPIALSGPKAEELNALLHPLFLGQTYVAGPRVGQASALKLAFAGITKGLQGLVVNSALLADEHGVGEALQRQLGESRPDLLKVMQVFVPQATAKAFRWVGEMDEISTAYRAASLPSGAQVFAGLSATQALIARSSLGEEKIEENLEAVKRGRGIEEVVKALREQKEKERREGEEREK